MSPTPRPEMSPEVLDVHPCTYNSYWQWQAETLISLNSLLPHIHAVPGYWVRCSADAHRLGTGASTQVFHQCHH